MMPGNKSDTMPSNKGKSCDKNWKQMVNKNRAEYRLILNQSIFRKIEQDNCFIMLIAQLKNIPLLFLRTDLNVSIDFYDFVSPFYSLVLVSIEKLYQIL